MTHQPQLSTELSNGFDALTRAVASLEGLPGESGRRLRADLTFVGGVLTTLRTHLAAESTVANVSRRLSSVPPPHSPFQDPGGALKRILRDLASATEGQRAYLFLLSEDGKFFLDAFEWCAEGVRSHDFSACRGMSVDSFPWTMSRFRKGETVVVSDPSMLPGTADPERKACETLGIESYVHFPVIAGGRVLGWLGVDSVGVPKRWSVEVTELMRLVADAMACAIERHRAEEAMLGDHRRLQGLAALGELTLGLAHDINSPLTAVVGNLQFAIEELAAGAGADFAETRSALRDSIEGADKIARVVRGMQILAGASDERMGPVDVEDALETATQIVANRARYRARIVRGEPCEGSAWGSPAIVTRIAVGLLLETLDGLPRTERPSAGPEDELRVSARADGDWVVLEVSVPRRQPPGRSLALEALQRMVRELGGSLDEHDDEALRRVEVRLRRARDTSGSVPGRRARVLVIDDEAPILKLAARMLKGHDVIGVDSGAQALALLDAGEAFDVILCDMMMPGMTGADVYRSIEARHPGLIDRIAFVSGGPLTEETREFLAETPVLLLQKPFEAEALRRLVGVVVAAHSAQSSSTTSSA